jgi:hypothetical protein
MERCRMQVVLIFQVLDFAYLRLLALPVALFLVDERPSGLERLRFT